MKRSLDDACANSQSKRGESYGQPQITGERGEGGGDGATDTQKLKTSDALSYLKEVKYILEDQQDKFDLFLDIMKDYKSNSIRTSGVIERVKELFEGHDSLLLGFNAFLPRGYEITLDDDEEEEAPVKRTVNFNEAMSFANRIKKRFINDERVYRSFAHILTTYGKGRKTMTKVYNEVAALFVDHPDLLEEFTVFLPATSATTSAAHVSNGRPPFYRQTHADKQRYRRDRINGPHTERDPAVERPELEEDKLVKKLYKEERKRAEKEYKNRRSRDQNYQGPDHENNGVNTVVLHSNDDKVSLKGMYNQEFAFFEEVEERLGNQDDYQAFLKCISIYSTEIITRTELLTLVADLFANHPDLMERFIKLLERWESTDGLLDGITRKMEESCRNEGHVSKLDREQRRETDGSKENDKFKEKYWNTSIQDLDLSNCKRCTPSYRLLPRDYQIPSASDRTELGAQVLNDRLVSVTSGSEDYNFTHMRRNQYEESLFKCEDDRFELDMLLESVRSAAMSAEKLLNKINDNSINPDTIHIGDYFTVVNLRCIERVYGEQGLDMVAVLHSNPSAALPIILTRLKQKLELWSRDRFDFNKVWDGIYAKNHYKSLDHRSFYFKQQDSKNLSKKSLVAKINVMKQKKQKKQKLDDITSTLEFEYPDTNIHEDLFELIKYSCGEICSTNEQLNKVMTLWTTFLEPMLGVPSHSHCLEDTEYMMPKQSKSIFNGEKSTSLSRVDSCTVNLVNGDAFPKSDAALDVGADTGHYRISMETISGCDITTARLCNIASEDGHGAKSKIDDVHSSENGDASKSVGVTNGVQTEGTKVNAFNRGSAALSKIEKEEGELSSNDGIEEDSFVDSENNSYQATPNTYHISPSMHCSRGENGANIDDDESQNVLEAGEDVSGNESDADEGLLEHHGGAEGVDTAHFLGESVSGPSSEHFLPTAKPLSKHVVSPLYDTRKKDSRIFYGNDTFYVVFRLHQILYERLLSAKLNSTSAEMKCKTSKDAGPLDSYSRFRNSLYDFLDGSADSSKFEDDCRAIIGNQSYVLFTLDNLIYKLVKQLRTAASDEIHKKLLQLYDYGKYCSEKYVDSVYYEKAHVLLQDKNIYRFEASLDPVHLSIQLMDHVNGKAKGVAACADVISDDPSNKELLTDFMLQRKKRRYAYLDEGCSTSMVNKGVFNGLECKMDCN